VFSLLPFPRNSSKSFRPGLPNWGRGLYNPFFSFFRSRLHFSAFFLFVVVFVTLVCTPEGGGVPVCGLNLLENNARKNVAPLSFLPSFCCLFAFFLILSEGIFFFFKTCNRFSFHDPSTLGGNRTFSGGIHTIFFFPLFFFFVLLFLFPPFDRGNEEPNVEEGS